MNRDGIVDVLVAEGTSSCHFNILALDGLTGKTVWEASTTFDPFALRCEVDVDGDEMVDCLAAGRQSGFTAFSGLDGSVLWHRDSRLAYPRYNFYYPLLAPDLDFDGIPDLINIHGGDTTYRDSDRHRSPAFLVALSARTGRQLMEPVPVPDGHESYMSPVLFHHGREELGDMILVGTGGETLPGSLWAVTMDSLKTRIFNYVAAHRDDVYVTVTNYTNHICAGDMTNDELEDLRPIFDKGSFNLTRHITSEDAYLTFCPEWAEFGPIWNEFGLCVYRLVATSEKGVLLPPVMVDMNEDGQDDLVVSCFEGRTLVLDGESGKTIWEVYSPGTESYR